MAVKVHTLSNGLRVVLYPDETGFVYLTLITRGGARFELPEELGVSHILEHLCTRKPEIHYAMESIGAGLDNAKTGAEDISYFFSFPIRNVLQGIELFARLWTAPISAEEFERERSVIGIEYAGQIADPGFVLDDLFMETAWRGHPLSQNTTSLWQDNLARLTLEQLENFRSRIHCGSNTVLAVVGKTPLEPFLETLERTLGVLPRGKRLAIEKAPLPNLEGFTVVKKSCDLPQVHCLLGFALPPLSSKERSAREILNFYLGDPFLFSAVLFNRVRNDLGLVYYIESETAAFYDSNSLVVRWTCAPENVESVLNVVMEEIRKIVRDGVSQEEFRRVRAAFSLRKEGQLWEPVSISIALAEELIRSGRVSDPKLWPKQILGVRRADMIRFAQSYLNPDRAVLALYGPVENLGPRILI